MYLNSNTRAQSLRLGFINAFQSKDFEKEQTHFQNMKFVSGLKSKLTATEEEREACPAALVHLRQQVQYP